MAAREEPAVVEPSDTPPSTPTIDTDDTAEAAVEAAVQAAAELPPVEALEAPVAQAEKKQVCIVAQLFDTV